MYDTNNVKLWTGGISHCETSDSVDEQTDVSLITGRLRHTGTRHTDDNMSGYTDAVVKRNEQMTVADNSASMLHVHHSVLCFMFILLSVTDALFTRFHHNLPTCITVSGDGVVQLVHVPSRLHYRLGQMHGIV